MLNLELWTSFEKELKATDVQRIEDRLFFLKDILEDAIAQYSVEDISGELDLNLHVYLDYFNSFPDTKLTPWLIHDAWFNYYSDGVDLNPELHSILKSVFLQSESNLHLQITGFLKCLDSSHLIFREVDAVVWLSFLDYMASKLIHQIGYKRMQGIFDAAGGGRLC